MSQNISYVVLSIVIYYLKHHINVLTHKIKACAIHFCIKILETSYPVMRKNNWLLVTEILKITSQLTGYSVKFHGSNLNCVIV